jgi:hypothetical protein
MKSLALPVVSFALLLSVGSAGAGQCTSEIDSLTKALASRDAGSGPTVGVPGSGPGQHPPTSTMGQADPSGAASRAAAQSDRPQHPPTDAMNREATGSAEASGGTQIAPSSSGDMQTKEQPTASATMNRETHGTGSAPAGHADQRPLSQHMSVVSAELERARMFEQQGKEAECLSVVAQAKLLLGSR